MVKDYAQSICSGNPAGKVNLLSEEYKPRAEEVDAIVEFMKDWSWDFTDSGTILRYSQYKVLEEAGTVVKIEWHANLRKVNNRQLEDRGHKIKGMQRKYSDAKISYLEDVLIATFDLELTGTAWVITDINSQYIEGSYEESE